MGYIHIPLDGLHVQGPHRIDGIVIVIPIGQPHQGGPHPGDGLDFVVAGVQIRHHLVRRQLGIMGVGVGVVHHLMPRIRQRLYRLRVLIRPLPHHKKGGLDVILTQNVNELLGILVPPGRVKADGHQLLVPLDTVDGQLAGGGRRSHHRRIVYHIEHQRRQTQAQPGGPPLFSDEKDNKGLFGRFHMVSSILIQCASYVCLHNACHAGIPQRLPGSTAKKPPPSTKGAAFSYDGQICSVTR